jgi:hypothetical protein
MPTIEESQGAVKRARVPIAVWIFTGVITLIALGGWFVLPHTPAIAGVLVVVVILTVGAGVMRILTSRQLSELPHREPVKAPSIGGD